MSEPYDGNFRANIPSGIALPGAQVMPNPIQQAFARGPVVVTNTPRPGESLEQLEARANRGALGTQVGGDHYTKQAIQPFTYSMANKLDPMQHTIIKYVTRFRDKGGLKDLLKAKHTIDLLIENDYGVQK
jgi:hypothetical protein